MAPPSMWTIVVGGGSGRRYGGAKQYDLIDGQRVIDRSVATARACSAGVVVVVPQSDVEAEQANLQVDAVVAGGTTRSASVRNGLAAVPAEVDLVAVHDAARPLASSELFAVVAGALVDASVDAAVPAVAVTDTIRHRRNGTVDRADLVAVQTPQVFRASALRRVHADAPDASDDAGLLDAAGATVVIVEGDASNIKITRPVDLEIATVLLAATANRETPTP